MSSAKRHSDDGSCRSALLGVAVQRGWLHGERLAYWMQVLESVADDITGLRAAITGRDDAPPTDRRRLLDLLPSEPVTIDPWVEQLRLGTSALGDSWLVIDDVGRQGVLRRMHAGLFAEQDPRSWEARWRELRDRSLPYLPRVLDAFGDDDNCLCLVTAYVSGRSMTLYLDQEGPGSTAAVVELWRRLGHALAGLAQFGLHHGHLAPWNVIYDDDDHPWLCVPPFSRRDWRGHNPHDFDLGNWAAPERGGGGAPSPRSEVYELGGLGYHLLTGDTPGHFQPGSADPRLQELTPVLTQALHMDPASRYANPADLLAVAPRSAPLRDAAADHPPAPTDPTGIPEYHAHSEVPDEHPPRNDGAAAAAAEAPPDADADSEDATPAPQRPPRVPTAADRGHQGPADSAVLSADADPVVLVGEMDDLPAAPELPESLRDQAARLPEGPTDIHCRLLPDGLATPPALEHALACCRQLVAGELIAVVATVPWLHPAHRLDADAALDGFEHLVAAVRENDIPLRLAIGGENHWSGRGRIDAFLERAWPLADGSCVLIDLPDEYLPRNTWDLAFEILRHDLQPIIAHAQSNAELAASRADIERFCAEGGLLQVDLAAVRAMPISAAWRHAHALLHDHGRHCVIASGRAAEPRRLHGWKRLSRRSRKLISNGIGRSHGARR
ncbi:MAG: hypothetical protein ACOCYV_00725 [Planctomycetota bacterium]